MKLLQDTWAATDRDGAPQIVALDFKPDPDKLAGWPDLGVTEVLFGLPDRSEPEVAAYVRKARGQARSTGLTSEHLGRRHPASFAGGVAAATLSFARGQRALRQGADERDGLGLQVVWDEAA